jgi:hypothetical protein
MAAVLPGACRRTHRRFSAQAISRATYSWGQPLFCSGKRCNCFRLEQETFPVLAEQPALALCQARLALQPQFSSGPSRQLAGHGLSARTRGADVLELPVLSSNHPGTRPSRGPATILPPALTALSAFSRLARAWVDSLGASTCEPPGGIHLASSFACPCYLRPETQYETVGCAFR